MSKFSATAEELIQDFSLEELLEMNDLLPEDVVEMLLEEGLIDYEFYRRVSEEAEETE